MKKRGKGSNGASAGAVPAAGGALALTAGVLAKEMTTFEALTERLGRLELTSEEKMVKAGELLKEAAASHLRFVEGLRAMIDGIEDARQRQNKSAAALAEHTAALESRRLEYTALVERFQALDTTDLPVPSSTRAIVAPAGARRSGRPSTPTDCGARAPRSARQSKASTARSTSRNRRSMLRSSVRPNCSRAR